MPGRDVFIKLNPWWSSPFAQSIPWGKGSGMHTETEAYLVSTWPRYSINIFPFINTVPTGILLRLTFLNQERGWCVESEAGVQSGVSCSPCRSASSRQCDIGLSLHFLQLLFLLCQVVTPWTDLPHCGFKGSFVLLDVKLLYKHWIVDKDIKACLVLTLGFSL